jgi:ABC-2 type transport system ATP-binding protein
VAGGLWAFESHSTQAVEMVVAMEHGEVIRAEALTKWYNRVLALDSLSLEVRRGEVFGLLGPNGSGKTTTIRLLLGLLRPTSGRALIAGFDCWRNSLDVRSMVSYLPGELRMYGALSGLGTLKLLCDLRDGAGLDRAVAIAERVMKLNLRRKVRTYSTGMKQKLALAQVFSDPVDTLILDEPTSALDPSARSIVLGLVQEARTQGQTVIFSGHVLAEVEQVSDRVAIMRKGRLMHVEDMHKRRLLRMILIRFAGGNAPAIPEDLALSVRDSIGDALLLEHRGDLPSLLRWLACAEVDDIAIGTEDLRSLYDQFHGPNVPDEEAPV